MARRTVSSVNRAAGGRRPGAGAPKAPASGGFFSQNFGQAPFAKRTAPGAAGGRLNTAVARSNG